MLEGLQRRVPATTTRSTVPPEMCSSTQSRTSTATNIGHSRFMALIGMRGAGNAKGQSRLGTGIIQAAGHRDADIVVGPRIDAAEVALIEIDALLRQIDAGANRHAVDADALFVAGAAKDHGVDHRIAARDVERPAALPGGRFQRRLHGELVAAGFDLERHHQAAAPRIPIEPEIGVVDGDAHRVVVVIDDGAGVGDQLPLHHLRCAVRQDVGAHAGRQRQVGFERTFVEPQRQQYVAGRYVARFDADRADAVGERTHRRAQDPGPRRVVGFEAEDYPACCGRVRLALI